MAGRYRVTIESETDISDETDRRLCIRTEETNELGWSLLWALEDSHGVGLFGEFMAKIIERHYDCVELDEWREDTPGVDVRRSWLNFIDAATNHLKAIEAYRNYKKGE